MIFRETLISLTRHSPFFRYQKVCQLFDQQISGADEGTRFRHGRLSAECITGCVYKQRTHDRYTVCGMVTTNVRANPRFQRVDG